MDLWETIRGGLDIVSTVAGIFDDGPEAPRPNPYTSTFNYVQQRVGAAESVRQLGWQAWMAGKQADLLRRQGTNVTERADLYDRRSRIVGQGADVMRGRADLSNRKAGDAYRRGDNLRARAGDAWSRSGVLRARAQVMEGLADRMLSRGQDAANAAYERTMGFAAADRQQAVNDQKAAKVALDAAVGKAETAIARANIKYTQAVGTIELGQAQAGLRTSSYTAQATGLAAQERNLAVTDQRLSQKAARGRYQSAVDKGAVTRMRAGITERFAGGQRTRALDEAADRFTQAGFAVEDMAHQATQWGLQAAEGWQAADEAVTTGMGHTFDAQTKWLAAAGQDVEADALANQAGATRLQGEGLTLAGRGQEIQQDFFQTGAEIGRYFLGHQPDVTQYGGTEEILQTYRSSATPVRGEASPEPEGAPA